MTHVCGRVDYDSVVLPLRAVMSRHVMAMLHFHIHFEEKKCVRSNDPGLCCMPKEYSDNRDPAKG